ncbi:11108_t:CDS:2, partial [Acaulospora colombiana]
MIGGVVEKVLLFGIPELASNGMKLLEIRNQLPNSVEYSLKGVYVTAEDVGVKEEDVAAIFSKTRFTTCIPPEYGGSGNPSYSTARGVVCALEAAFSYVGKNSLQDSTFAVQAASSGNTPQEVAIKLAEQKSFKENPIFGHR